MPFIKNTALTAKKPPTTTSNIILGQGAGGGSHSLYVKNTGQTWAWGSNGSGQLGNNSIVTVSSPVAVLGATKTFCEIRGGGTFSGALDKNGKAWSWGLNAAGQLGTNSTTAFSTPVAVLGAAKTFCKIALGGTHALAIDKNGKAWAWGSNTNGRLGNNAIINVSTPIAVLGATKTFCEIAAALNHSLAIDKNGKVWAWGAGLGGVIGNGSAASQRTPVSITGTAKTFCKIAQGPLANFSLAIDKNGRAWAWGNNASGQLGNNATLSQVTPVSVAGTAKTFCHVAAGGAFAVALDKNGKAWAWGANGNGQVGNNSFGTNVSTPVAVLGATKTFCKIATGNCHVVAVDKNGLIWTWGLNTTGQLGDKTLTQRTTPVRVCNI